MRLMTSSGIGLSWNPRPASTVRAASKNGLAMADSLELTIPLVTALEIVWSVVGLIIIAVVFYDLFQTVVLPRPAVGKVQIARYIVRPMWVVWRWVSQRTTRIARSEARMAAFAPIALLTLFLVW